ncbi:unnamed protein product [Rotaria sp. Silwood2]|nr:unnamed protein product [Rotaria sp. Silwood2]CAF2568984.1 unnamed protein product [Rotaria sp. Silwood2]CAF2962931.1 unnamed protein product [Rotaria sp. Silwood2]CAF4309136.1 unnamed protein product [Rotaria sp. Silwood2]CAF4392886.1 unnamed protein product [Rotaria sp. Silwood2]
MNILNSNDINILDLPDEILRIIFNKLNTIDIFYSLVGVNKRFDRLALDSLYIHHLDFVIQRFHIDNSSVDVYIDKICEKILPQINEKVTKLTLDPFSVERILDAVHYPQLHSLSLVNFQSDIFLEHLSSRLIADLLCNQITHLTADIYPETAEIHNENGKKQNIFLLILWLGKYLTDLTFSQPFSTNYLTFSSWATSYRSFLSSTLTNLTIEVNGFDDCLYLLNGSLESLSTLIIRINKIKRSSSRIDNTKKLVKLKYFSLRADKHTYFYDEQIVPLLRRMLNLEELTLQLSVVRLRMEPTYINGHQLYDEVLNYMPRLHKFIFCIHTQIYDIGLELDLPSSDEIRKSFIKRRFQSMDACAHDKFINDMAHCHVYSIPYPFNDFLFMSSCFQGGKFDKVRLLSMFDERPFEHKLFKIISQDFPFLQLLIIYNLEPQENDQHDSSTLITFNHLLRLNLNKAHKDYVIQFLSDRNTHLSCLMHLIIKYQTLATVTNNFTNDATRLNCAKVKILKTHDLFVRPQNFHSYFPSL